MIEPRELNREELRNFPLPPWEDTDKDEHGRLLICAGSRDVPGSATLAAAAAFRSGAGKVQLVTAESVAPGIALLIPELLAVGVKEADDGGLDADAVDVIRRRGEKADAILAGPGMRRNDSLESIVGSLLKTGRPLVLDAATLHILRTAAESCRKALVSPVLLPHSGEMASLLDCDKGEVDRDPPSAARRAACHYRAVVLAKGSTSFIASPDERTWVWRGGVPGLGVAGSGDVLAGIVAALLARGAEPLTALLWGVLLHGEAGERLSKIIGPVGFRASEIPDQIPALLGRQ
jgi:hydroxyethylthiazole kinase-like uncharacterized protein yjeF